MAKSRKQIHNAQDKAVVAKQNEKIINDLLLQFAYTLTVGVLAIFVYNAIGMVKYGVGACKVSIVLMWALFILSVVGGIVCTAVGIIKKKKNLRTLEIYLYITAIVSFWVVGFQKVVVLLKGVLPFLDAFTGHEKIILAMFPMLGIALVVEFVVYFVKYYSINRK